MIVDLALLNGIRPYYSIDKHGTRINHPPRQRVNLVTGEGYTPVIRDGKVITSDDGLPLSEYVVRYSAPLTMYDGQDKPVTFETRGDDT